MTHTLKCIPEYFRSLADGSKTVELRFDDRNFQKGDMLEIRNWSQASHCFVEPYEPIYFEITHILKGERWGIKDGWAALSIKSIPKP